MRTMHLPGEGRSHLFWRLLSVPISIKVLGIGAVVAVIFGSAITLQTRTSMSRGYYEMLERSTVATTRSLAMNLERPMIVGDMVTVSQKLRQVLETFPDARYVVVRDPDGEVVAHTFDRAVPRDLQTVFASAVSLDVETQLLSTVDEFIFDTLVPILSGYAGSVQFGMSDQRVARRISTLTGSVLNSLWLCVGLGIVLAFGLTYVLTQPIHHLESVADRIRNGDLEARAETFSADEIGRLAVAFNHMAESLEQHRREVEAKEQARLALVEQTIQAQEDERKNISQELHDQFGQSLLALLLMVQAHGRAGTVPEDLCREMEKKIGQLIDEIRQLIQGMRPPILDDYGLDVALARFVEEVSNYLGCYIDYQYSCSPGLDRLPNRIEVTLYRIAQEAVTNVVRHANAHRASVVVLQRRQEAVLVVEDQGCGFDAALARSGGGIRLGLTGMTERAALLGGVCTVESELGRGTTVTVKIPLVEA